MPVLTPTTVGKKYFLTIPLTNVQEVYRSSPIGCRSMSEFTRAAAPTSAQRMAAIKLSPGSIVVKRMSGHTQARNHTSAPRVSVARASRPLVICKSTSALTQVSY